MKNILEIYRLVSQKVYLFFNKSIYKITPKYLFVKAYIFTKEVYVYVFVSHTNTLRSTFCVNLRFHEKKP